MPNRFTEGEPPRGTSSKLGRHRYAMTDKTIRLVSNIAVQKNQSPTPRARSNLLEIALRIHVFEFSISPPKSRMISR